MGVTLSGRWSGGFTSDSHVSIASLKVGSDGEVTIAAGKIVRVGAFRNWDVRSVVSNGIKVIADITSVTIMLRQMLNAWPTSATKATKNKTNSNPPIMFVMWILRSSRIKSKKYAVVAAINNPLSTFLSR